MKKVKAIIAGISAGAITLTSAASCGKEDKKPETADKLITNSYSSQELDFPEGISRVDSMYYIESEDKVIISGYDYKTNETQIVKASPDLKESDKIDLDLGLDPKNENSALIKIDKDGNIYACTTVVTHGGLEAPDWDDENFDSENFDFEAYDEAAEYTYAIHSFDSSGNLITECELESPGSNSRYLSAFNVLGKDKFLLKFSGDEDILSVYNSNGKMEKEVDKKGIEWINYIVDSSDGKVYCDAYDKNGESFYAIDSEKMEIGSESIELPQSSNYVNGQSFTGTGDYLFYLPMNLGIYGMKKDNTLEEVVNWMDSDIDSNNISASLALNNGDFIIATYDYEKTTSSLSLLTKRDPSQLSETKIITLATFWSDSELTSKITAFNKANSEYRIKIKDYSEYDEYDEATSSYKNSASKQLAQDIVSGKAPDMIYMSDYSIIQKLAPKGVFADLYEFIDKDENLSKEDFLPNVLSASEINGKLYGIANTFGIETYGAKASKAKDLENWTLDQMIETFDSLPEGVKMFKDGNTKESVCLNLITSAMNELVDYDKKTCSFDSEYAKKVLEFCDKFPKEDASAPDYDNMTDEEWEVYWNEQDTMIVNDKAFAEAFYLNTFRDFARARTADFGEDVTFLGIPSGDKSGGKLSFSSTFSILNDSPNKDAAWSFISENFFSEEAFKNAYQMPVIKKYYEIQKNESMERPYYYNDKGEKEFYDDNYYINNKEIKIDPLTQDEVDMLDQYIQSCTFRNGAYNMDIYKILEEELKPFYEGDKSADEVLKMVQNRVSIIISEQN